ncbi:MAG: CPBP family intramembrane metalloprotease [Spirochaetaceae bacterium]|nr:CPBP family intramembrane metalloprotease [Spirochaetaceae bacterium]
MNNNSGLKYLLPIRSIMFILIFVTGAYITKRKLSDISSWWSIVASIVNLITILILVFAAKKAGGTYRQLINYEKGRTKISQVLLMSLCTLFVGTAGMYLAGFLCYGVIPYSAPMMIAPIPLVLAVVNFVVLPLTVSFAEDGLYLGCGVNQIENNVAAVFVPAFFYALQHSFIPTLFDAKFIIYRFLSFLPLTIIFCWYYKKNKNPVSIMIGHAFIEIASVAMILATSMNPELYEMMCNR